MFFLDLNKMMKIFLV